MLHVPPAWVCGVTGRMLSFDGGNYMSRPNLGASDKYERVTPFRMEYAELTGMERRVQARVVQHHYVRSELRYINMQKASPLIQATMDALARSPTFKQLPTGKQLTEEHVRQLFDHMTNR